MHGRPTPTRRSGLKEDADIQVLIQRKALEENEFEDAGETTEDDLVLDEDADIEQE